MDRLDLLCALADAAAVLRAARAAGIPAPLACLGGHDSARFSRWGPALICCACGRVPLPADQLHAAIVRMLRAQEQTPERKAA